MSKNLDIDGIEDVLIETTRGLGLFKMVESALKDDLPETRVYPAAFWYLVSAVDQGVKSRSVYLNTYEVTIVNKTLKGATQGKRLAEAKKSMYELIKAVRDAVVHMSLGIDNIEKFSGGNVLLVDYVEGEISYAVNFSCRHFLPVPAEG